MSCLPVQSDQFDFIDFRGTDFGFIDFSLFLVFYCIDFCGYLYCFLSSAYFGLNLPINSTTWIIVKFLESIQTIKAHSREIDNQNSLISIKKL